MHILHGLDLILGTLMMMMVMMVVMMVLMMMMVMMIMCIKITTWQWVTKTGQPRRHMNKMKSKSR
jgi:hypothetical protein